MRRPLKKRRKKRPKPKKLRKIKLRKILRRLNNKPRRQLLLSKSSLLALRLLSFSNKWESKSFKLKPSNNF